MHSMYLLGLKDAENESGQETLDVNQTVFVYRKTPECTFNDPDQ